MHNGHRGLWVRNLRNGGEHRAKYFIEWSFFFSWCLWHISPNVNVGQVALAFFRVNLWPIQLWLSNLIILHMRHFPQFLIRRHNQLWLNFIFRLIKFWLNFIFFINQFWLNFIFRLNWLKEIILLLVLYLGQDFYFNWLFFYHFW